MSALITVLLLLLKAVGILLLVALGLIAVALLIPVSLWLDYHDEDLTVKVGALGFKYTLLPQKEKPEETPKAKSAEKPKAKTTTAQPPKATASEPPKAETVKQTKAAQPPKPETAQQPKAAAAEKPKATAKEPPKTAAKQTKPADANPPKAEPQDKTARMQLTFDQVVTAVKGLGAMGKRIVNGLKVKHIRLYLPVTGEDAADTAIQYGKMQAWLHAGLGVLNRAIWLDFDECRLEADFLAKGEKKSRFSCQISARLLIMVIAVTRFVWLLWKANILPVLIDQFAGKEE